ncbi:ubiquitin carboxyl-terminal hydrolase calypso [Bacillus rossius redtenbacheri]|uniref:ubiquitin carboxyl-terminal hydrolase calypso n=1 Tax=Bacillus rossius redtenbacheri TaxID=93214 RepID=UPI002FDCFC76
MPVDINSLTEGWLELESDPGLFTLLLEDFGVNGVQVEEIYDLQKSLDDTVYGFIFLFRWTEERRSRRKIVDQCETFVKDEEVVNNIFFAQQIVPNSCATHALLSVLLNCPKIHLGDTLSRLKAHTVGMCPENKGWAIGNTPELAKAHNSHAMPQARRCVDKSPSNICIGSTGRYTGETFHFVSYVPIQGKLFELDGLKPYPMDHGPWGEKESWTEKFRRVITDRLETASQEQSHDIRFNLMAVVPDRRLALTHKLNMLKTNKQIVSEALQQLVKLKTSNTKEEVERLKDKKDEECNVSNMEHLKSIQENEKQVPVDNGDAKTLNQSKESEIILHKPVLESQSLTKIQLVGMMDSSQTKLDGSAALDYSTPLTVQTSPAPSCSSTDTSSEVGSAFNSPTQGWGWNSGQSSPMSTKDFKKLVVVQMATEPDGRKRLPAEVCAATAKKVLLDAAAESGADKRSAESKLHCKYPGVLEPHAFAPNDLLSLLRSLEGDMRACEASLRDENEKRKQYQIDDCRRTHNYDDFICTFLSMLAQQGKLADLVQQHLLHGKKPGTPVGRMGSRVVKKTTPNAGPRRRRTRAKCRRRK